MPFMPEVIGTDDEAFYRIETPRPIKPLDTKAPLLHPEPHPLLLQPTVYDPSAKAPRVVDDGLSTVQRCIEADMLAEAQEAAARSSALQRAKETVLAKLSREFTKHHRKVSGGPPHSKDSAAVVAGLSELNLGMNGNMAHQGTAGCGNTSSMGLRIREGLFGRSMANVVSMADHRSLEVPLIFSRS
jgi:hypothetical protein